MPKDYIPVALKRFVSDRANGGCEYCRSQAKFAIESLVIEHIIPTSRGGDTIVMAIWCRCLKKRLNNKWSKNSNGLSGWLIGCGNWVKIQRRSSDRLSGLR